MIFPTVLTGMNQIKSGLTVPLSATAFMAYN